MHPLPRLALSSVTALAVAIAVMHAPPASAESDAPTPLVSSPLLAGAPDGTKQFEITSTSGGIQVNNHGNTTVPPAGCSSLPGNISGVAAGSSLCVGSSHARLPGQQAPAIGGLDDLPFLTWGSVQWIRDEAIAFLSAHHDVSNAFLLNQFARSEIRAYVQNRLISILDKKLYGQPLTPQEQSTYKALVASMNAEEAKVGRQALAEYNLWAQDPCGYSPPPLPGAWKERSDNPYINMPHCWASERTKAFIYLDFVPPYSEFDTWARARLAGPKLAEVESEDFLTVTRDQMLGAWMAGAVGAGIMASALAGVLAMLVPSVAAAAISVTGVGAFAVGHGAIAGTGAAILGASSFAGPVFVAVVGALISTIALLTVVDEHNRVEDIHAKAAAAGTSDDPLQIDANMSRYAGLDMATREQPDDDLASPIYQTPEFEQWLGMRLIEWFNFDAEGNFVPDPVATTEVASGPNDKKFLVNNQQVDTLWLASDDVDANERPISMRKVHFSDGMMRVSELRRGQYGVSQPRLNVRFLDHSRRTSVLSVINTLDDQGRLKPTFLIAPMGKDAPKPYTSDTVEYVSRDGAKLTAKLIADPAVLPPANVVPTVHGVLKPGRLLKFQANPTSTLLGQNPTFEWTIERTDGQASPEDLATPDNAMAFQHEFSTPGAYRVSVKARTTSGVSITAGHVDVTVHAPTPEVYLTRVIDNSSDDDSLLLDLRVRQDVGHDTFNVEVQWADDLNGNVLTEKYTVQCRRENAEACDTDPVEAGTNNPNWSKQPKFTIPASHNVLPYVTVTVTNSHGVQQQQLVKFEGVNRPRFADQTPYVQVPIGNVGIVDVVEVVPAQLGSGASQELFEDPNNWRLPSPLPEGLFANLVKRDDKYFVQLSGSVGTEHVGVHTFTFPVIQDPQGRGRRAIPASITVDIRPNTEPGFRAFLQGVPWKTVDYRDDWPMYLVALDHFSETPLYEDRPTFDGEIRCVLKRHGSVIVDEPCREGQLFPWPDQPMFGDFEVSVLASGDNAVGQAHSKVFSTSMVTTDFTVKPFSSATSASQKVSLKIWDPTLDGVGAYVPAPYRGGYQVECRLDRAGAWKPCFADGTQTVTYKPGQRRIDVRITTPDDVVFTRSHTWKPAAQAAKVTVTTSSSPALSGKSTRVRATGLRAGEPVTIHIGGKLAWRGTATSSGRVDRTVTVTRAMGTGKRTVQVTGEYAQRTGKSSITVLGAKKLRLKVSGKAKAGKKVTVRVSGLSAGEKVTVHLGGKRVSSGGAKANSKGVYTVKVKLPKKSKVTVKATGALSTRKASTTIRIR